MDLLLVFVITFNFICYSILNSILKNKSIWKQLVFSDGNQENKKDKFDNRDKKDQLSKRDQWLICNVLCSLVHSMISACWTTWW